MASSSSSSDRPIVALGTNQAPFTGGNPVTITSDIGPLAHLSAFSIRNGELSSAKSLLVKATLAKRWHWCPIAGLPHEMAISKTAAYIRVALHQLTATREPNETDEQIRKMALILGVSRAVVTQLYSLSDSDFIPGERADPILRAVVDAEGGVTFFAATTITGAALTALSADLALTDEEKAAVASIHMCAIGLPPVQGYSLFMTGHHYLSDPKSQSRRAFDVVERANWESSQVKSWWEADAERLRDVLWHKSCHPIVLTIKMTMAQSPACKEMLIKAGAGPAASRLPALESEMRAANSSLVLLRTVRPMFELMGGMVVLTPLEEAISCVDFYPAGEPSPGPHGMSSIPAFVVNRKTAVAHLANVLKGNTDLVGRAFGFYCAMHDRTALMATGAKVDTLIEANSLRRLESESPASFIDGRSFYDDYLAKKASDRAAGRFPKLDLVLHEVGAGGIEKFDDVK